MKYLILHVCLLSFLGLLQSCKDMSSLTSGGLKSAQTNSPTGSTDDSSLTLNMRSPSVVEVNQCVPLIISLINSQGTQVAPSSNLSIILQSDLTTIYSENTCTTPQSTTVVLSKNTLSKIIYAKAPTNQSYVFGMQELNGLANPQSFILSVTNPVGSSDTLKLTIAGPTTMLAGECRSYAITLQNSSGVNKNASSNLSLALSGEGTGGQFYTGSNCSGGAIHSITLNSGSSFVSLSYKNSTAENVTLLADSPAGSSIQSGFYAVQVNALATTNPTQLVLSGPSSVTAGSCSGPVVVRTVDASFSSVATSADLPFSITGGAGFSLFSDAGCTTTLASPKISASSSSTSFYFIAASAGNIVIAADDSGPLTDGSLSVQAAAAAGASAVKFTLSGPSSIKVQNCSSAFVIKTANGSGIESPVNATTTVNITGKGSGDFYADAACTSVISSLTFASGDSSKPFYYKGTNVADLTFNVDDPGPLTPASFGVSITPDVPSKFILSGPSPITLGDCRAYTVTTKDANDFVSSVSATTSVNLSGAGAGAFYSDSSCVNSTSSVVINSGQSAGLFYFKTSTSGSLTLSADNSGGLTTATKSLTVDPLAYSKVVLTRPALSAGNCTAISVTLKDSLNNTSLATSAVGVSLSSGGSSAFYSASNCLGGTITSTTVASGQSSSTFYFKDNVAENLTIGATSTGLTSDSWSTAVASGSNSILMMSGLATTSVGSCTAYDLNLEDAQGNLSPASSSFSINFSGLSSAKLYSDVNCLNNINSITLAQSASSTQVYLKSSVAENITISATSGALVAASKSVSLIAGSSNKLVMNGISTASAGNCSAFPIEVQDSFGNPIVQGSPVSVTVSGNTSGSFYSDSGCTSATSTATINAAASSTSVWFKSNVPGTQNLLSQASGLFDGSKNLTINPLAPSKLVMTGSSTISVGVCTAYSITLQDTLNNLSSVGSSKTLNFSGAGSGAFYSDSSCSLPVASISLTSTQTQAQIYYKASAASSVNLTADDSGLPDLVASTVGVTVNAAATSTSLALKISGATSINTNICVPYAVMVTDVSGMSYNVTSNMTVTMAGAGTGTFYSDSGCTSAQPTVTVTNGTSMSYIYYKAASAQNLVFSATATGASANTLPVAVASNTSTSGASRLTIAGSTSILTNNCIPYVVSVADANGNSTNATANTTITLSGAGNGDFYTENTCTTSAAGSTSVNSGSSYTTVFYKNASVQNLIFIAQSAGLSNGTLSIGVSSTSNGATFGPPVKLSFVAQPSAVASTNENFGSQPIVAIQDTNNNVASSAGSTITLAAYTDSSCTLSAGAVLQATANPLNANGGIANFAGVNITSSMTVYLKASSPGLASACSQAIQIYPAVASKLNFSQQPSTTAIAGTNFTTQPQVSILNYTNNVVTNATNLVSIAAYTDSTCTTPATGTFNLSSNNVIPSSGVASFSGVNYTQTQTIYLKAAASGLTPACSSGITVSSAPSYQIGIQNQPATSGRVGDNFSMIARLYDTYGNLALDAHTITLTAYKSSNCTGATSTITGGSVTSTLGTAVFSSIVFQEASTMSFLVSDTTNPSVLSICSNAMTVDGGTPTKLSFSTQPSSTGRIYTSLITSPVVQVQDTYSNLVKAATNQVTISAYTDNTCSTPAAGILSAGNLTLAPSQGLATFSTVSYTQVQTIYLKATSSGLTSVCSSAIALAGLPAKIVTKNYTTCATINGGVWCWGTNNFGNGNGTLGDNAQVKQTPFPSAVVGVGGTGYLTNITDVALGDYHGCALSSSGSVYCWGYNAYGQLGDNTNTDRMMPVQVVGPGGAGYLSNIVAITAASSQTCALNSSGTVYCWGFNSYGQLGDGTTTTRYLPTYITTGIVSVSTGSSGSVGHTCAVTTTGSVYCWGYNGYNQLGDGTTTQQTSPVQVKGVGGVGFLTGISSVATSTNGGTDHTCAMTTTGSMYCWGYNGSGQIGDNTAISKTYPTQVKGIGGVGTLSNVVAISLGNGFSCALLSDGTSNCWGNNGNGNLGDNTATNRFVPVQVKGVGGVGTLANQIAVSAGINTTCSLTNAGAMYCWGYNGSGQIGDQTLTQRSAPVQVKDAIYSMYSSVSTGTYTSCGILREQVYCWGYNNVGQIGDGTTTNRNIPTLVSSLSGVKAVSVGDQHTCALLKTGSMYCWGYNSNGQLGNNTTTNSSTPIQVQGVAGTGYLANIVSISAGQLHTCAVDSSGNAYCWGYNGQGGLGDNTVTGRTTPVQVHGVGNAGNLTNIISISAGYRHTCAVSSAGVAYCWGYNNAYQLGDGTSTNSSVPLVPSGLTSGVTAISTGFYSTCAIKSGAGYCWGGTTQSNSSSNVNYSSTPAVLWSSGVTSIAAGSELLCAVVNQKVNCYNASGSYAYHSAGTSNVLKDVLFVTATSKNYGYPTICALRNNGVIYCWGYDNNTSPFNGGTAGSSTYPTVISLPSVSGNQHTIVSTGETHSCGILNGITQCWGTSNVGALGSAISSALTPSTVLLNANSSTLAGQMTLGAGGSHNCSLSYAGEVFCWGDNTYGKLGNNTTTSSNKAVQVVGVGGTGTIANVSGLAVGYRHNCALSGGYINCWGNNTYGQLGINSTMSMAAPIQVVGVGGSGNLTGATQVVAGRYHTCALVSGSVYCWGSNLNGQLGANSAATQSNTPLQVVSVSGVGTLNNVTSIAAGAYHTCALAGGIIYCWGANSGGQLGNGSIQDSSYPVGVMNSGYVTLTGVTSISAGYRHSCATSSINEVLCWGAGSYGQLGENTTADQSVATNVVGVGGVGNLTGGVIANGSSGNHMCSISTDQANIYCWGLGSSGQIGNGTTPAAQLLPTPVTVTSQPYLMVK